MQAWHSRLGTITCTSAFQQDMHVSSFGCGLHSSPSLGIFEYYSTSMIGSHHRDPFTQFSMHGLHKREGVGCSGRFERMIDDEGCGKNRYATSRKIVGWILEFQ
jgi:hypothetical protein